MDAKRGTQTVLITGATGGLGKAAALLLAENGFRVFAAGRSAEKRAQLDTLANEKKLSLETLGMDVCDDGSVQRAVNLVYQKAGTIDVLINNAGLAYVATVEDMTMEDWRRQFETNFFGVVRVTQAVLRSESGHDRRAYQQRGAGLCGDRRRHDHGGLAAAV